MGCNRPNKDKLLQTIGSYVFVFGSSLVRPICQRRFVLIVTPSLFILLLLNVVLSDGAKIVVCSTNRTIVRLFAWRSTVEPLF